MKYHVMLNHVVTAPGCIHALIARFRGPTWGPSGAARTQVGPMLAPWTLLSGWLCARQQHQKDTVVLQCAPPQTLTWPNADSLSTWSLENNISETSTKIHHITLEMSSAKWWPFSWGLSVLVFWYFVCKSGNQHGFCYAALSIPCHMKYMLFVVMFVLTVSVSLDISMSSAMQPWVYPVIWNICYL